MQLSIHEYYFLILYHQQLKFEQRWNFLIYIQSRLSYMKTSSPTSSKMKKQVRFFRKFSLLSPFFVKNSLLLTIAYFLCQLFYLLVLIAPIISMYSQHWYFKLLKTIKQLVFYTPSNTFQLYIGPIILLSFVTSLIIFLNYFQSCNSSLWKKNGLTFYNYSLFALVLLSNTLSNLFISTMLTQGLTFCSVLATVAACILFITLYLLLQLSNEIQYKQFSKLSRIFQEREGIISILKTVAACLVSNLGNQHQRIETLLIFFVLLLNFLDLKTALYRSKYLDSTTESIYQIKVFLEALCLTTFIFVYIMGEEVPEMVENILPLQIIVFLLSYYGFNVFKQYRYKSLIQDRNIPIECEDEVIEYMLSLTRIASDVGFARQYLLKLNLVESHCRKCQNISCFCYTVDQKKKINILINEKKFIQKVIYDRFTQIRPQFSQSFIVLIIYISYKLSFLSLFSKIQHDLRDFTARTKLNFSQRYVIFQLSKRVQEQVQQITIMSQTIEMEKIFTEQFIDKSIQNTIQEICTLYIRKYTLLEVQAPSYTHIQQICYDLCSKIKQMELFVRKFRESNSYNLRIYEKCLFYSDKIIDNIVQAKQIRREMILKLKMLHSLKGINKQNMDKYLYTKKACVIQSNLQIPIGTIRNVSNSCFDFFGHEKYKIMDKDIHYIMPPFLIPGHKQRVLKWLSNQSFTSNLVGFLDFFFIKPNGVCFNGKIHLKLATNGYILILYVYLVKEDEDNFIVVSKQNVIQGIGRKLINQKLYEFDNIGKNFPDFSIQEKMKKKYQYKYRFQKINYFKIENKVVQFVNAQHKDDEGISTITYDCQIVIKKHFLGSLHYYSVKFFNINKIFKDQDNLSLKSVHTLKQYPIMNYKQVFDRQTDKRSVLKDKQVESILTLENEDRDKYQTLLQKTAASSSVNGDKLSLSSLSIRDKIKQKFMSSQDEAATINLGYAYIFLSFILLGTIILLSPQIYLSHRGKILDFLSKRSSIIQQIQMLELQAMNSIIITNLCKDDTKSNPSCIYLQDYLNTNPYEMIVQGIADYYNAIGNYSLGTFKNIYISLVGFSLLSQPKKVINLQIADFYQHSIVQMKQNFQHKKNETQKIAAIISQIFINRNNLNDWKKEILAAFTQVCRQSLTNSFLIRIAITLSIVIATITILWLAIKQKSNYTNGLQSVLQLNLFLKKETSLKFKVYYQKIRKTAALSEYNQIDEEEPNVDYIYIGRGKRAKFEFRSCFTCLMICSYLAVIGLYVWNELLLQKDANFLDYSLLNSFQLLSKQDNQIEMFYSFQETYFYDISKLNKTIQALQKSGLDFIENMKNTIPSYYKQAQISFLIQSIPELLKQEGQINQKQYQYAMLQQIKPLMDNGIINSLTYVQKWALQNSLKLLKSNQTISKAEILQLHSILSYFVDFFKIMNFRLYQDTIAQTQLSLGPSYAGFASALTISLILLAFYRKQMGQKKLLYGIVYQLPTSLVLNRYSFSIIKNNIELEQQF